MNYFNNREFACHCGCETEHYIPQKLMDILNNVRIHFGKPVIITSGHRCETHNRKIGGVSNSQHILGKAADIMVRGVSAEEVHKYIISQCGESYGVGKYKTFTHIDIRKEKARW